MLHNDHCSFCGSNINNGVCTNEQCLKSERELPAFPWSKCHCGDSMFNILNTYQLLSISWLGLLGLFSFIAGIFFSKLIITFFGLWIIIAWYMRRKLIYIEFITRRKYIVYRFKYKNMKEVFATKQITLDLKNKLEITLNKMQAYRSYLLGIKIFHGTITLFVIFSILSCCLISFTNISTYIDSGQIVIHDTLNRTSHNTNKILKIIQKEINWDRTEMLHLRDILVYRRGISIEQFKKIVELMHTNKIKKSAIVDMVDKTDKCTDGLYNYIIARIGSSLKKQKNEIATNFPVKNKELQEKQSSYIHKLGRTTALIFVIVDICLFILIIFHIIASIMVFVLASLYFSASATWSNLKRFLIDIIERGNEHELTKNKDRHSNIFFVILGGILTLVTMIVVNRYKEKHA